MPEINLLGTNKIRTSIPLWQGLVRALFFLVVAAVLGVLGWYGYTLIKIRQVNNEIVTLGEEITSLQDKFLKNPKRQEILVKQGQLKEANVLLSSHLAWSKFLPRLARTTLRTVRYISLDADNKGNIKITADAPSYEEVERFLDVFNIGGLNESFTDVRVTKIEKAPEGDVPTVRFSVSMRHKLGYLGMLGPLDLQSPAEEGSGN